MGFPFDKLNESERKREELKNEPKNRGCDIQSEKVKKFLERIKKRINDSNFHLDDKVDTFNNNDLDAHSADEYIPRGVLNIHDPEERKFTGSNYAFLLTLFNKKVEPIVDLNEKKN